MAKTLVHAAHLNEGLPSREHFRVVESVAPTDADVGEGGILIEALYLSADPYMRSAMRTDREGAGKAIGAPVEGFAAGRVVFSRSPVWVAGDLWGASTPFVSLQVWSAERLAKSLIWKLSGVLTEATLSRGCGVLGMPGATAYGGLIDVLKPVEGETLLVTAASGAVGALVGQIAKRQFKCKVVGTAGGPAKCARLLELGFDAAIDHKECSSAADLISRLKAALPGTDGKVDMVFENVGGWHFDAAFASLGRGGRIAVCGGISSYGAAAPILNVINPLQMIYTAQRIEGFVCGPWLTGKRGAFLKDMASYLADGVIIGTDETVFSGIEAWPDAFQSLFTGANVGKAVVRL